MIKRAQREFKFSTDFKEVDIELIEKNGVLPYSLYVKDGEENTLIVKAGTLIDEKIYAVIQSKKNAYISKNDLYKKNLKCKNLEEYISYAKSYPEYCIKLLYRVNSTFFENFYESEDNRFDAQDVESIVKSIIILIKHEKNFLKENMCYFQNDNSLPHHSLHVCIYAIKIGDLLGFSEEELIQIGTAGYLQDIGIKNIDEGIVSKDGALTIVEIEKIHQHVIFSMQLVKHNRIHNPHIIEAIKHHHENYDGSGYPDGISNVNISKFAAILSICDVFDALTSNRPYRKEMSSFEALTFMMKDEKMSNKFNHQYIKVFIKALIK